MKILLACLMCIVLPISQAFAIKGGPDYGGAGRVRTTGIYAGILVPQNISNSIGLFSVSITKTGIGTGSVFLFATQEAYTGTFQGVADPDSAKLAGFISANFPFVEILTSTDSTGHTSQSSITVLAVAAGQVRGKIRANKNVFSTASVRITGESQIEFSPQFNTPDGGIFYNVVGFKQQEAQ